MIAVIFEFTPADGRKQEYFDLVAQLRAELDRAEGFLSLERFESLTTPGKFVSLQFWKDEASVAKWRNVQLHRKAQAKGRAGIFDSYRLRVAGVLRDYSMGERAQAPKDSVAVHG
jgi:heme-degrading monooxygenase HmoA